MLGTLRGSGGDVGLPGGRSGYDGSVATVTTNSALGQPSIIHVRCVIGVFLGGPSLGPSQTQRAAKPKQVPLSFVPKPSTAEAVVSRSYKLCSGVRKLQVQNLLSICEAVSKLFDP